MKQFLQLTIVLIILTIISACDLTGDDVFVYTTLTETNETLKVNAVTEYNPAKKALHIKAIIDVYDKDKKYKKTIIYVIKGSIEGTPSMSHENGPLTILTDRKSKHLTDSEKKQIKAHVLSHTNQIKSNQLNTLNNVILCCQEQYHKTVKKAPIFYQEMI